MTTNLKRRADQMHEAKTDVQSEPKYYMLHYSKIRTRVTKCDSGEGVKVEMCEPTIKKVIVSLNDADAAVLRCNVGKNVRMFSDIWERLCKQQTLTQRYTYLTTVNLQIGQLFSMYPSNDERPVNVNLYLTFSPISLRPFELHIIC